MDSRSESVAADTDATVLLDGRTWGTGLAETGAVAPARLARIGAERVSSSAAVERMRVVLEVGVGVDNILGATANNCH